MIRATLCAAAVLSAAALAPARADDPAFTPWSELVDSAAQNYEDPYRTLSPDNLSDLATLVRLEDRLDNGDPAEDVRPQLEARIAQKRKALEAAGIDLDWLLAQRWVVKDRRQKAALAVNPEMNGKTVMIGGFLIPAPPTEDGRLTAYLVPERGMCAHVPPPPPNQLLQLLMDEMPEITKLYEPVIVRGTLAALETRRQVYVADGSVPMWSAWTLIAHKLTPNSQQTFGGVNAATSDRATSIAERFRASGIVPALKNSSN